MNNSFMKSGVEFILTNQEQHRFHREGVNATASFAHAPDGMVLPVIGSYDFVTVLDRMCRYIAAFFAVIHFKKRMAQSIES